MVSLHHTAHWVLRLATGCTLLGVTSWAMAQPAPQPPAAPTTQPSAAPTAPAPQPPAAPDPPTPASKTDAPTDAQPAPIKIDAPPADADADVARPKLHHAPVSAGEPGEPLEIEATLEHPELVKFASVVYRTTTGALKTVPFLRSVGGGYTAVIPAEEVKAPGIAYAVELERTDGVRVAVFASRTAMHPIWVPEERMDARERALYQRLGGRRSVAMITTEFANFGTTTGRRISCGSSDPGCPSTGYFEPQVDDQFWKVEGSYTYRPLRTVAEFSLRAGVVRGTSLVGDGLDDQKNKVGLNYGAPAVRFRFADAWHLELNLLTSITEIGFSVGFGNALLIGDPYGSKLTLGFEVIGLAEDTYFGSRFYSRMDMIATDRITVSPIIEITDMPHADAFGVRLLGEAGFVFGNGFAAGFRVGYQARKSTSGGIALGGNLSLAF